MTNNGLTPRDAPTSYSPKEMEAWFAAGAKGARVSRMDAFRNRTGGLENVEIQLDMDAATTRVKPSDAFMGWLRDLTGEVSFDPHFELPAAGELVVRALGQGRFHGVRSVEVDGEVIFKHEERSKDTRGTVDLLTEASHRSTRCDTVKIEAVDDEYGDCRAIVTLKRLPKKNERSIHIRFEGVVQEVDFQAMLSFLRSRLNATFPLVAST
jgi:hypothetical protein